MSLFITKGDGLLNLSLGPVNHDQIEPDVTLHGAPSHVALGPAYARSSRDSTPARAPTTEPRAIPTESRVPDRATLPPHASAPTPVILDNGR
jgi:hypothetical protein